jgi:ABC-type multidrug transport system fused ATPase/permease subunit
VTDQSFNAADRHVGGIGILRSLYHWMSPRRRRHLQLALLLMIVGAVAELMTIGAILPFLALISNPASAERMPAVRSALALLGWSGGNLLLPATILLAVIATVSAVVRLALTWVSQKFIFRLGHEIGTAIYSKMLRRPYSVHVKTNSSETLAAIEKVQTAIFGILLPVIQGFVAAFIAIFIIAILLLIDTFTAVIAAVSMAAVYICASFVMRRLLRHNSEIINDTYGARIQLVQEGLGGIRDIILDQSQEVFEEDFRALDDQLRSAQTVNVFVSQSPRFIVESAGIIVIAFLALYMSYQPGGVVGAIPVLGALALGAQRLLPLLQLVYNGWTSYAGSIHLLQDIVGLLHAPAAGALPRVRGAPFPAFRGEIRFDAVSFRYGPDHEEALRDVSLAIPKGERIGLLGETGSGKSTMIDLLMGLLEPTAGRILIDGVALDDGTRARWQGQIAHVPQVIFLADNTIAANIAFGEPAEAIDFDRVREAAKAAQIHDFVEGLPNGYAERVGERGVRLSGGQRQRLGIARALYKRAAVLILDEATSALDDSTEAAVMDSLSALGGDLTVLMIAHRLSTLADCDRLVRLAGGRITQVGSFADVIGSRRGARAAP